MIRKFLLGFLPLEGFPGYVSCECVFLSDLVLMMIYEMNYIMASNSLILILLIESLFDLRVSFRFLSIDCQCKVIILTTPKKWVL
jgi:hypothetical protein